MSTLLNSLITASYHYATLPSLSESGRRQNICIVALKNNKWSGLDGQSANEDMNRRMCLLPVTATAQFAKTSDR